MYLTFGPLQTRHFKTQKADVERPFDYAYALSNSFIVQPHVRYVCCLQRMLAFTTSAADMGKRLLLSEVNL
jgi:hypothetical protein